jgi:hypothetical protein
MNHTIPFKQIIAHQIKLSFFAPAKKNFFKTKNESYKEIEILCPVIFS